MSGYRQSALLLHGLHTTDQRWILDQLSKDDQEQLRSHLLELKQLGIPADRSTLANLGISETGGKLDELQAARAADMQLLLKDEPLWLVKQVLSMENWPWKPEFIAGLNHVQADKLQQMQLQPAVAKAQEILRSHLLQQLRNSRTENFNLPEDSIETPTRFERIMRAIGL